MTKRCTYFVQGANKDNAIKRAYEMFRDSSSCCCPSTVEKALMTIFKH